jgi:short-subunit dehydrogenase
MKDKTVVITGASTGLGKVVADKLAKEGAKLILVSHNEEKLQRTSEQIAGSSYYVCDVSVPSQVRETTATILQTYPVIDILINCAGIWTDEQLEQTDPDRRKKVLEVNTLGTIEVTKAFEASFRAQNKGHIVNVISTAGNYDTSSGDNTMWQTYGASKWALSGFTRAFKDSLTGTGVKVTGFYPGGFESDLYESASRPEAHNQPWMMKTEDVADALIFCLTRPEDILVEKMIVTKFRSGIL